MKTQYHHKNNIRNNLVSLIRSLILRDPMELMQHSVVKLCAPSSILDKREFISNEDFVMTLRLRLLFFENYNMFIHGPWALFYLM